MCDDGGCVFRGLVGEESEAGPAAREEEFEARLEGRPVLQTAVMHNRINFIYQLSNTIPK